MIRAAGAALLLLVSVGNGDEQARPPARGMTIHQQIIIRVEPGARTGNRTATGRRNVAWQEERTTGVVGFFGASSMERLPTEVAMTENMKRFKALAPGG